MMACVCMQRSPGVPLHGRHQHPVLGPPATARPPRPPQVTAQAVRQGASDEGPVLREPPQVPLAATE